LILNAFSDGEQGMQLQFLQSGQDHPGDIFTFHKRCEPMVCQVVQQTPQTVLRTDAESACLYGKIDVPDIASYWWLADNAGTGFNETDNPIDFRLEACRSRLDHLQQLCEQWTAQGMPACCDVQQRIAQAQSMLQAGEVRSAIGLAFRAGEKLVEHEMTWRLDKPCQLDLGINAKGLHHHREAWDAHFADRFNWLNIPLVWGIVEPEQDQSHLDELQPLFDWARQHHMKVKGHGLIWHCDWWESWQPQLRFEQLLERSGRRIRMLLGRFGDQMDIVELINEPMQVNACGLTLEQQLAEVQQAYDLCKEIAPHIKLMISFFDEDSGCHANKLRQSGKPQPGIFHFIDQCLERGMQIDLLGLQYHIPECLFDTRMNLQYWHDRFGLPLHITELTPCSDAMPTEQIDGRPYAPNVPGLYGKPWSEAVQLEHVQLFMDLFRALPFVEQAAFWGTTDNTHLWADYLNGLKQERYRLPWAAGQGLLREDLSPKPALEAVEAWQHG
jgi:endo-1,4-beta-xylanase